MFVNAIALLLSQLNQYIHHADGNPLGTADPVVWGNISQIEQPEIGTELENHVVLTLVNVEEEAALKNNNTFTREPTGAVHYHNPELHLNLILLFTANFRNYETALKRLAQVMMFFQGKQKFTPGNSPGAGQDALLVKEFQLTMELLSLNFEQVNHLWGFLGGKHLPFAPYRGRLVTLRDRHVLEAGGDIREVEVIGQGLNR